MADIELVVKIDENDFHRIISGFVSEDDAVLFAGLLKKGTPLPKGHGKLIDADALTYEKDWVGQGQGERFLEIHTIEKRRIDNAPTVVEADEEV